MNSVASPESLVEFVGSRRELIEQALESSLPHGGGCPAELAKAMHYAVFPGGKRLRPLLTLLASHVCGGTTDAALPAACAVELVHCYSLVHDDLPAMDDDELRRGRPTCHKKFGEALAILAGDALLTLAFDVMARQIRPSELAVASCRELAAAAGACGMVGGQTDDMSFEAGTAVPSDLPESGSPSRKQPIDMLESMHARKTGALLRACLRLGGLAATASTDEMHALDLYGQRIGLLFQITDDLLDVQGTESVAGKRVGKDQGRGKLTFPQFLGTDASRRRARLLFDEASAAVVPLGRRGELLVELARSILERDR